MKIGVNSASGQLGQAIIEALLANHPAHEVVALARTPAKVKLKDIESRAADYTDRPGLEASFQGLDAILLVSANGAPEPRVQMHRNVNEAALAAGVKKLVYTSIMGETQWAGFSPVVKSNRQTEEDLKASGLEWSIGRNGIYIEPDIEYQPEYAKAGKVRNCAGEGACAYTTRDELAYAYTQMLDNADANGNTYNLCGSTLTQQELTNHLNRVFGTSLSYEAMSYEAYVAERNEALGGYMGEIIAGIYQAISLGQFDKPSDYEQAAGRPHIGWQAYFENLKP